MDEEDFPRRTRSAGTAAAAASGDKKGGKADKKKKKVKDGAQHPADDNKVLFQEDTAPRRVPKRKMTQSFADRDSQKKTKKQKKKKTTKQSKQKDNDSADEEDGANDGNDDDDDDDLNLRFLGDDSDDDEEEESAKPKRKKKDLPEKKASKRSGKTKFEKALADAAGSDDDDEDSNEEGEGKKAGNKKRKVKPLKGSLDEDLEAFDRGVRRRLYVPISQKTITSDLLLLGVVKEVRDYEIVVSLPGGATGFMRITDISDIYTSHLEQMSNEEEEEENTLDIPRPSEVFRVGSLLTCKVKSTETTSSMGRPRIQVTVKPAEVNSQLVPAMLSKGMVLNGCVSSREDHGYMVDVGVGKVKAFLGWKEARPYETERNLGKPLYIGQPIQCLILKVQANGRSLILTSDPSAITKAVADKGSNSALQTLLPGATVPVTVVKVSKDHVVVTVLGSYSGHICQTHLEEHAYAPSHYKPTQELTATVISNNQNLKTVALSLNPRHRRNHFEGKVQDPFANVQQGDVSDEAKALRVDAKLGVLVNFKHKTQKGYIHASQYSDKTADLTKVKTGQRIKCRIVDFNWFDGLVVLTAKKSVVELPFLGYHGIKPGDILEGKVFSFSDKGVKVQVADRTFGFIPNSHLADIPISKPKDKYKEGDKLKLRVLTVDAAHRRLLLTHKQTMVSSTLPAITAYDQVEPDMMLHGVIVAVKTFGCIVSFYNDIKGLIPTQELSSDPTLIPAQAFRFGQVVKCRVSQVHHPTLQKITLSLRSADSTVVKEIRNKKPVTVSRNLQFGQIESVRVTKVTPDGLTVSVISNGGSGFIPIMHLSDHHDNCRALLACYKQGSTIPNAMSWSYSPNRSCTIFTLKRCIREMSDKMLPSEMGRLEDGAVLMGHVKTIMPYGVFVEAHNNLIGLAPKGGLSDEFVHDTHQCYNIGQTVRAKITQVDKDKGRFLLSLRPSVVKQKKDEDVHLLEDYLTERDALAKKLPAEYKHIMKMLPGSTVSATVTGKEDGRLVCSLPHGIMGIVITQNEKDLELDEDSEIEACVLHRDVMNKTVYLSLKSQLIENDEKSKKKRSKSAVATVEFVHPHFVLAFVAGEGLVYLPGKKHLNDLETSKDKPVEGQTINVSLKRVLNGRVLVEAVRNKTDKEEEMSTKRLTKAEKLESLREQHLGHIVKAKIESILDLQLYVTTVRGIFGRVHVTQITDDVSPKRPVLDSFKVGDNITAKVIGHRDIKDQHILAVTGRRFKRKGFELSMRKSVLENESKIDDEATIEQQLSSYKPGQEVNIVAQAFKKNVLIAALTPSVHGKVFQRNLSLNRDVINDPEQHIKPGTVHRAHVVQVDMKHKLVELSLKGPPRGIREGSTLKGSIISINPGIGLTVKLPQRLVGNVHIMDIHDRLQDNPLKGFVKKQRVSCYILSRDKEDNIAVSMKPSLVTKGTDRGTPHSDITEAVVKEGQLLKCYVTRKAEEGVIVWASRTQTGRISVHKMPQSQLENLEALYPLGKLVVARVISIDGESGEINLSRLPEDILPNLNDVAAETVSSETELNNDDNDGAENSGKRKRKSSLSKEKETTPTKKRKSSEPTDEEEDDIVVSEKTKSRKANKVKALRKSRRNRNEDDSDVEERLPTRRSERTHNDMGLSFETDELSDTEVEVKVEPSKDAQSSKTAPRLAVDTGFSWDDSATMATIPISKPSIIGKEEGSSSSSSEDESDEEEDNEVQKKQVKKSRKEIEAERKAEEDYLYKTEHALMDNERTPETAEDFDRLVLSSPDSSLVWIRYMAFHLHSAEVEKARAVAERALKAISFREEQEKLNVWVAFLNLENMYGTEETLMNVFERALKFNEPIKVFQQLVNIYVRTEKIQAAEELYSTMVKRFNFNKEIWINYGLFLMKIGKHDTARKLMQRSFKSIPQAQHVDIIVKFSQMEFKFGEVERGKTMFENILSNYPKRTDIWSVYLDMMIKDENLEATRHVFERVIHLTLSAKKMKFFFKRYLDFEKKYGTDESVDSVKQKAVEYVESKAAVGRTDES